MMRTEDQNIDLEAPWFPVPAKRVARKTAPYYLLRMQEYVRVVAFTSWDGPC
jgi:hypothetical protein